MGNKWCNEHLGEWFISSIGNRARLISRFDQPSVELETDKGERFEFCIGSRANDSWSLEEKKMEEFKVGDKLVHSCNCNDCSYVDRMYNKILVKRVTAGIINLGEGTWTTEFLSKHFTKIGEDKMAEENKERTCEECKKCLGKGWVIRDFVFKEGCPDCNNNKEIKIEESNGEKHLEKGTQNCRCSTIAIEEEVKVVFGMDIITDTKIPKGTVAIGYKKDDVVTITNIKQYPLIKKSLSDKKIHTAGIGYDKLLIKDVREANKEFLDWLEHCPQGQVYLQKDKKAKEIYGEDLI